MSFSSSGVRETFTVKGYPVVPKIVNVCYHLGETPKGRRRDGRVLCPKRWQSKFQTIFRFARSRRFCKGMVLEAAVNGHADALVTFNVRDFGVVPSRFGIEVLLPREAIGRVKSL